MKQNSAVISEFGQNSAGKENSKQNFYFETRVGVGHDICTKRNSAVIPEFSQISPEKAKFYAEF